jgi:fibronectin type 3 domain-containing protein
MTFVNATGNFSGEAYDYDPNNLVTWETLGPPPVPQNIAVQIVGSSIQVTWSASTGASSYQIYRSLDP